MEFAGINIAQFSDIGFALLVGGICLRTLLFDRDANIKQRAIWKHELTELEKSLRQLIDEATTASEIFDRQLCNRHKSIEELLDRAENMASKAYARAVVEEPRVQESKSWEFGEELPDHLVDALELSQDKTSIKSRADEKVTYNVTKNNRVKTEPVAEPVKQLSDEKIFAQTSIVDPIAYKIAKRLLLEGKELHIIARKLEIPVSEIRHLETLIRQGAQTEKAELPQTFLAKEIENVTNVIRDPALRKANLLTNSIEKIKTEAPALAFDFEEEENKYFGSEIGR